MKSKKASVKYSTEVIIKLVLILYAVTIIFVFVTKVGDDTLFQKQFVVKDLNLMTMAMFTAPANIQVKQIKSGIDYTKFVTYIDNKKVKVDLSNIEDNRQYGETIIPITVEKIRNINPQIKFDNTIEYKKGASIKYGMRFCGLNTKSRNFQIDAELGKDKTFDALLTTIIQNKPSSLLSNQVLPNKLVDMQKGIENRKNVIDPSRTTISFVNSKDTPKVFFSTNSPQSYSVACEIANALTKGETAVPIIPVNSLVTDSKNELSILKVPKEGVQISLDPSKIKRTDVSNLFEAIERLSKPHKNLPQTKKTTKSNEKAKS